MREIRSGAIAPCVHVRVLPISGTPPRNRKPSSADNAGVIAGAIARSAGAPPNRAANWVSEA